MDNLSAHDIEVMSFTLKLVKASLPKINPLNMGSFPLYLMTFLNQYHNALIKGLDQGIELLEKHKESLKGDKHEQDI